MNAKQIDRILDAETRLIAKQMKRDGKVFAEFKLTKRDDSKRK